MVTLGTQYTGRRQPKHKYTGAIVVMIVWLLNLQLPMQSVPITTESCEFEPHSSRDLQDTTFCDKV